MALRLIAAATPLVLSALLSSCGPEGTDGLSGPWPTIPANPSPAAVPDARSVPVEPLVPEGATVEGVLYGRLLPGEGEQIVIHSTRDIGCTDRQDYVQVIALDEAFGEWRALFRADRWPSPSRPLIPDREELSDPCEGYETLELMELVDMEVDGETEELVLALSTGDDEPGPLPLKVLSFRMGVAEAIYDEVTTRGGAARLLADSRISLEQGTYPSQSSPLWRGRCCPNGSLTEVIGWDQEYGQVNVLESSLTLYCRQGAVDEVKGDALIVSCHADGGQRHTGYRLTDDTRVLPKEFGDVADLRAGQEVSVSVAEPLELDEDWHLEPIATEIRVLTQRYARFPAPGTDEQAGRGPPQ